jgi:hypothetical protein
MAEENVNIMPNNECDDCPYIHYNDVAVLDPPFLLHRLTWAQVGCHVDLEAVILH